MRTRNFGLLAFLMLLIDFKLRMFKSIVSLKRKYPRIYISEAGWKSWFRIPCETAGEISLYSYSERTESEQPYTLSCPDSPVAGHG